MKGVGRGLAIAALGLGPFVACGSKSGLSDGIARSSGGAGGSVSSGGAGGSVSSGGAGGSVSTGGSATTGGSSGSGGAGGGDASTDALPPPCLLAPTTEPIQVVAYAEGGVGDVGLVVIDEGALDRPGRVAYLANNEGANFWHPELRVAQIAIGSAWPASVQTLNAPVLFGFDAHSGGVMSHAANGAGLALAFYHADEASPTVVPSFNFRSFDVDSWSPGPERVIDLEGGSAYALAAGQNGYAVAYRANDPGGGYEPRIALLDATGELIAAPVAVTTAADYPGIGASVAALGSAYLFAANLGHCPGATESCGPLAIGVGTIQPGPAPAVEIGEPIPYLPGSLARRPSLASFGDRVWMAWREAPEASPDGPWAIRVAAFGSGGALEVGPILLDSEAAPQNGVGIHVSDLGVVVSWAEVGLDPVGPSSPGHSQLVFHQLDHDGVPLQQPFVLQVTELASDPPHAMVRLAAPRSLVLGWAGRAPFDDGPHRGLLARLECAP